MTRPSTTNERPGAIGEVSVFHDLSGPKPAYMARRDDPQHPDLNGWFSGRELQQALQAAVDARR